MTRVTAVPPELIAALADVVGREHVLTDADLRASYETDWTGRWTGTAAAVVRPEHLDHVRRVLEVCAAHGTAVVPQGGNTGLVGGGVPASGEVVLSLRRMDHVSVDPRNGLAYAGAGATLAAVQRAAAQAGWMFGVDLASRDSATIGGMIATNAGGIRVVRYGSMRRQVVGLEAIMADSTWIRPRMETPGKNNTGYDLAELLIGSEGTLAVVVRATLRLVRPPQHRVCALIGLDSLDEATALLPRLRELETLEAAEFMFDRGVHLVAMHGNLPLPFDPLPPVLVLVECAGRRDPTEELALALAGVERVAVAVDREERERLWAYRERHTEAINALGVPLKLDVATDVDFAQFVADLDDDLGGAWPEAIVVLFGHLAEGNVHVNVLPPDGVEAHVIEDFVLRQVLYYQGGISAEHGIGRAKRGWLTQARGAEEVAVLRAVKAALDPHGLLNPGVLLP